MTLHQQLYLVSSREPDRIEKMREYVSFAGVILQASGISSQNRTQLNVSLAELKKKHKYDEIEIVENLSPSDCLQVQEMHGSVYPYVWEKMLEVYPHEVSKELLLQYKEQYCYIQKEILLRVLDIFAKKDASELLIAVGMMTVEILNKILRVFSKEEARDLFIEVTKQEFCLIDHESQLKVLRVFSKEDATEIIKALAKSGDLCCDAAEQIFEIFDGEAIKEIFEYAFENDVYLDTIILKGIIDKFSKEKATAMIKTFFTGNVGRNEYEPYEVDEVMSYLRKKRH